MSGHEEGRAGGDGNAPQGDDMRDDNTEALPAGAPLRGPTGSVDAAAILRASAIARAERSERFFLLPFAGLLLAAGAIAWVGVVQVRARSEGIRQARKLSQLDEELRDTIEGNRRLEAEIVRTLDPVVLRRNAVERHDMRVPEPDEAVEVP